MGMTDQDKDTLAARVAVLEARQLKIEDTLRVLLGIIRKMTDHLGIPMDEPEGGLGLEDSPEGKDEADQVDDMDTPDTVGGLDDDEI
jgi:hypothetical protein